MKTAENNKLRGNTKVERIISITYKRRRLPTAPFMSEDIVLEILVRLPVKDILRCRTVCKSWLAITKDLRFTCRHLQQSISKNNKYFLMVPQTLHSVIEEEIWPSTFSNNIPFYTCQEGHHTATLLFARDFSGDFGSVYRMSHRDGLVLVPTDTKVYVINPATRDVLVLPDGQRDTLVPDYNYPQAVGFGLDPRTKRYKVARFFYRAVNIDENFYSMGMEVLTICGDGNNASWRETLEDPPYPVLGYRVPAYFKGSLFWIIGSYTSQQSPKGFLRFHLEDETFSFIPLPASACGDEPLEIMGRGEQLYLAQCQPPHHLVIWMFCDTRSRQWRQLYSINISEPFKVHSTVMLHDGLYFHKGRNICRCDMETGDVNVVFSMDQLRYRRQMAGTFEDSNWTNVHSINWMPYMESLVPVTRARCDRATPTPRLLL